MADHPALPDGAHVEGYTRHGLEGPFSFVIRPSYTAAFVRVVGDYAPVTFSVMRAPIDPRGLPVKMLEGDGLSVATLVVAERMTLAQRNAAQDEVHIVSHGKARLETDFGVLEIGPGDVILIPRAVSYRLVGVQEPVRAIVLGVAERMLIDPQNTPAAFNPFTDLERPAPYAVPYSTPGEYEVVVRHATGTTSYFYASDPLPILHADGAPVVQKFNIAKVHPLSVDQGTLLPSVLLRSESKRLMMFGIGQRRVDPIDTHHNADFGELTLFVAGPGPWGSQTEPGTATWTPRGVVHHGPSENVANAWKGFLIEFAGELRLTEAGRAISGIMNTADYAPHEQGRLTPL